MGQVKFFDTKNVEHVLDVDANSYIALAGRTNNPDYKAVSQRMVNGKLNQSIPLLINEIAMALDHDLDQIKKHLFYGRDMAPDMEVKLDFLHDEMADIDTPDMRHFINNPEMIDILHGAIGLATESGEILKALFKFMETGSIDIVNVGEENGDAFWYQALLLKRSGRTFEQVMTTNIQKLAERFKDGFTEASAINRDVVAERTILEQGLSENSDSHIVD